MEKRRICIYGAGAIGIDLGAALIRQGHEVAFIARNETLNALRQRGISCTTSGGGELLIPPEALRAVESAKALPPQDVVFLTVKSDALNEIAEKIPPLFRKDTLVVTAANGIPPWYAYGQEWIGECFKAFGRWDRFIDHVPPERVLGMVVNRNVTALAPGVVRQNAGSGYILGEPGHTVSSRCRDLKNTLEACGFEVSISDHIHRDIWHKLLINIAVNPLSVLTELPIGRMFDDDGVRDAAQTMIKEVHAVGVALGVVREGDFDIEGFLERFRRSRREQYTSMYQDYIRGRPLETRWIIDVVLGLVDAGKVAFGVPALRDVNERLRRKLEEREQSGSQ